MGIVVIGAVFVDIKGYPLATYIPGGRNAGRVEQVHGGVCRNVAEDIANVELRPTFVSLVDDTGTGQDVIDKLARHKVNTRYIQRVPDGMGTWLAVFNNEGDVVAAISKRPDTNPLTDLLAEKGDEIFKDCDGIAIEFDLEKDTVKQVLYFAQKYHKKVYAAVSNMSIAMERRDFLQQIDCFVCNQQEAGILFSDEYDHMGPEEMCRTLAANVGSARIPCMVVTMGDKGAVYACADGESGIVPAKKVNVIDTTGAGDAFFAGTVIGRAYGKTMAEACGIGCRKCLPAVPPAGVRAGCSGCGLSAVSAGRSQPPEQCLSRKAGIVRCCPKNKQAPGKFTAYEQCSAACRGLASFYIPVKMSAASGSTPHCRGWIGKHPR